MWTCPNQLHQHRSSRPETASAQAPPSSASSATKVRLSKKQRQLLKKQ